MPESDRRQVRTAADVVHLLPLVVVVGVAGLLATIAPSRVTGGVYEIIIGDPADRLVVPTESLTCQRSADTATCTTSVAGQPLAVQVTVLSHGPGDVTGPCTARHGERPVPCSAVFGDYGHASKTVIIPGGLDLSEPERTRLRMAVPWWRAGPGLTFAGLALVLVLAVTAAAATYLLSGRARPLPGDPKVPAAVTGVAAWLLFGVSGLVIAPSAGLSSFAVMAAPPAALATIALAAWQWQLTTINNHRRWPYAAGAGAATAVYTAVAVLIFLLHSGFID